jgi:hypothetical protein
MRLSPLRAAALGAVAAIGPMACAEPPGAPGSAGTAAGRTTMKRSDESRVFDEYKRHHDAIDRADSVARLEALADRIDDWQPSIARAFPADLAKDLGALLDEKVKARLRALQKPRGRAPRPDWSAELASFLRRLSVEDRSLQGLRRHGLDDPWIEGTLRPAVERSIAIVESRIEHVAREEPGSPLLDDARKAVERARAGLAARP